MTLLEHEANRQREEGIAKWPGLAERHHIIAKELLGTKCPSDYGGVDQCNGRNGNCLKCWLQEYKGDTDE